VSENPLQFSVIWVFPAVAVTVPLAGTLCEAVGLITAFSCHHVIAMDYDFAIKFTNNLLKEKRPDKFNSSWIRKNAPAVYRFIQQYLRTENGGIDWDRFTRSLDREFQKRWIAPRCNRAKRYRNKAEVANVLQKYHDKLYTFFALADKNDKRIRDVISITMVRIAQKGNVTAKQEIMRLLGFTIDDWIERNPKISRWRGYDHLLRKRIEHCIRCYRYSGTFIGYLFKTLEYAGRGLRPIHAYSLDDSLYSGEKRRIDSIGRDPETEELTVFGKRIVGR
jgi:hypothetical protein